MPRARRCGPSSPVITGSPTWGRDTMISLEGLTLTTGRHIEAGYILRTFAYYIRDGLIPNMFPEGLKEGLYHTADATLWYFHAIDRYFESTGDLETLDLLIPKLQGLSITTSRGRGSASVSTPATACFARGPRGISSPGWMPRSTTGSSRRGAARPWRSTRSGTTPCACSRAGLVTRGATPRRSPWPNEPSRSARRSTAVSGTSAGDIFTTWSTARTATIRHAGPNQLLAIALRHPVLAHERWKPVVELARERLLTPVGLRSLAPGHPDYKPMYDGDLRARDARLSPGDGLGVAHRAVHRRLAQGLPRGAHRGPRLPGGICRASRRGLSRFDQRDLRRRIPLHAAGLHCPGVERRRGAALLGQDGGVPLSAGSVADGAARRSKQSRVMSVALRAIERVPLDGADHRLADVRGPHARLPGGSAGSGRSRSKRPASSIASTSPSV